MKTTKASIVLGSLLISGFVFALSPPPPLPRSDLEAFYFATDGDQWQRNDGWLDDDTPICDWFGITCQPNPTWGHAEIARLELPGNNLQGTLDASVVQMINRVQVSVDLSHNRLSGSLPPLIRSNLQPSRLILAGNAFSGPVPDSWVELELGWLDLGDNQLDAGAETAFAAMRKGWPGYLNLAGNRFSGDLSSAIMLASLYETDLPSVGGGLNLCFNDFEISDSLVADWIDERHVGGPGWETCVGRERLALDPAVSGSWFAPDRSGEGISMMLLDDQHFLIYSFGFDFDGRQAWSFNVGRQGELFLSAPELLETRGDFNQGLRRDNKDQYLIRQLGRKRLDRVGEERFHVERVMIDYRDCPPLEDVPEPNGPVPLPCPIFALSERLEYFQLSRLAGSRCDQTHDFQALSGAWFNPEKSGEGFSIEVMADGSAVVYWYTYQPDGSGRQAWMIGQAPVQMLLTMPVIGPDSPGPDLGIRISSMLMPVEERYGTSYDAREFELVDWGLLRLRFDAPDFDTGLVYWESKIEGYGSGEYPIERLARPMLADCPDNPGASE
ncbi:MAG: hypothetical protein EA370_15825 [Wenzhouxiangella sp.]|nr:MAG: hypothetical protein EA370_15825 [Wenzhouxiangella sp.]